MFRLIFTKEKIKNRVQRDFFESKNIKKIKLFRKFLLNNRIYYPSNGIIFISNQTSLKDLKKVINIFSIGLKNFSNQKIKMLIKIITIVNPVVSMGHYKRSI